MWEFGGPHLLLRGAADGGGIRVRRPGRGRGAARAFFFHLLVCRGGGLEGLHHPPVVRERAGVGSHAAGRRGRRALQEHDAGAGEHEKRPAAEVPHFRPSGIYVQRLAEGYGVQPLCPERQGRGAGTDRRHRHRGRGYPRGVRVTPAAAGRGLEGDVAGRDGRDFPSTGHVAGCQRAVPAAGKPCVRTVGRDIAVLQGEPAAGTGHVLSPAAGYGLYRAGRRERTGPCLAALGGGDGERTGDGRFHRYAFVRCGGIRVAALERFVLQGVRRQHGQQGRVLAQGVQ